MKLDRPERRRGQDPTIALINIVFLMLIFFLLAGTVAATNDDGIELIRTSEAERTRPPAGPIGITGEGELRYGGEIVGGGALIAMLQETSAAPMESEANGTAGADTSLPGAPVFVTADQSLPASDLIAFLRTMREAGFEARIVTRSGGSL